MSKNVLLRTDFPRVRRYTKNSNIYYEVDCRCVDWKGQKKFSFTNKIQALERARLISDEVKQNGFNSINKLSQQLSDERLNQWNLQLEQHGKSIDDAVHHYIEFLHQKSARENVPLVSEICAKWCHYKSTNPKTQLRLRTVQSIRRYATIFAQDFFTQRMTTITRNDVEAVVDALKKKNGCSVSQRTRKHYLGHLRQFFNWSIRQGYAEKNVANHIEVQVPFTSPTFLTLAQCQQLLNLVQTEPHRPLVGYIALCLFAGLRPTEAEQLTWNNIEMDHDSIVITHDITKTKRGRRVEISSNLKCWLQTLNSNADIIPANFKRRIDPFRREFSMTAIKWSTDVLRHTYATFWLSKYSDRNKLAELMGNSPAIIGKHYLAHVNRSDAEEFWKLAPMPKVVNQ